jgi:hypothetical protein
MPIKKNIKISWLLSLLFVLTVWSPASLQTDIQDKQGVQKMSQDDQSRKLLDYIKVLTSESYGGRLTGTPEYRACADWVSSQFKKWGIQPAGQGSSYLRPFPSPYTLVLSPGEVSLRRGDGERTYIYEKDYFPGSNSASGRIEAEVVYVGYGITAPELGYDDYQGIDVKDKVILMEREVPLSPEEAPAEVFLKWKPYSYHQYKMKNAAAHGAKGLLYNYLTTNTNTPYIDGFLFSQIAPHVTEDLFAGSGKTSEQMRGLIQRTLRPQSFRTGKTCIIENKTEHHPEGIGYNVVGVIEGTDPKLKQEFILLGGHLDHVGRAPLLMPGANDNASGIAVMLGIAEALAKSPVKTKRSIMFIGIGGEELGLLGSLAYLAAPVVPLEKTKAFINMDSVGCGDVLHAAAADNYPEFWQFIRSANDTFVHRTIRTSYTRNLGRPRTDAWVFMEKGIPSISFSTSGGPSYAHTTKDTIETITPEILVDLARILTVAVLEMSDQTSLDFKASAPPAKGR